MVMFWAQTGLRFKWYAEEKFTLQGPKVNSQLSNDGNLHCKLLWPESCPRAEGQIPAIPLAVEKGGCEWTLAAIGRIYVKALGKRSWWLLTSFLVPSSRVLWWENVTQYADCRKPPPLSADLGVSIVCAQERFPVTEGVPDAAPCNAPSPRHHVRVKEL